MGHATFSAGRSGGFHGAPGFGAASGFRAAPGFGSQGFGSQGRPHFGTSFHGGFGSGFRRPFAGPRRFHLHQRFFSSSFSPFYFGYYGYPYYSDYSDSGLDSYPAYDYYAANSAQNDVAAQQQDIDRLEDEVARLRDERESREAGPRNQPADVVSTSTVLVFRDKHTQEVQNYAVVGGTLWIFSERRATKLPLSWLDIVATTKANDERGVDFRVPN
jgi:hypothetical protein